MLFFFFLVLKPSLVCDPKCHDNAECRNFTDTPVCVCKAGFTGNGISCTGLRWSRSSLLRFSSLHLTWNHLHCNVFLYLEPFYTGIASWNWKRKSTWWYIPNEHWTVNQRFIRDHFYCRHWRVCIIRVQQLRCKCTVYKYRRLVCLPLQKRIWRRWIKLQRYLRDIWSGFFNSFLLILNNLCLHFRIAHPYLVRKEILFPSLNSCPVIKLNAESVTFNLCLKPGPKERLNPRFLPARNS